MGMVEIRSPESDYLKWAVRNGQRVEAGDFLVELPLHHKKIYAPASGTLYIYQSSNAGSGQRIAAIET
jgi:biotin carboxyl carrier protein